MTGRCFMRRGRKNGGVEDGFEDFIEQQLDDAEGGRGESESTRFAEPCCSLPRVKQRCREKRGKLAFLLGIRRDERTWIRHIRHV